MKKIINYWPYGLALLPQFIFADYSWVIISVVAIGMISTRFIGARNVFWKMFIIELILFSLFFFIVRDRLFYVKGVLKYFEMPEFLLLLVPPVFNALNTAVLFCVGRELVGITLGGKKGYFRKTRNEI
ncbi:MAG TPA: hypothetical protein VNS58_26235 [Puia sp.]|nr:hypothetical protein [Puia sp.]